jgi:hypothetical protein
MSSPRARSSFAARVLAVGLLVAGCGDDLPSQDEPGSTGSSASSEGGSSSTDSAAYDQARLEILAPESASIHPLGEPLHLVARVVDPEGHALEADDVAWRTDPGEPPRLEALEGDVDLHAGIYALTATAHLPNGDRLETTVGGVRVQARWTGEYTGDVVLAVQAQLPSGTPLVLTCQGPLDFTVSLDGTDAPVDDGACTIVVLGQSLPATYAIEMVIYPAGLVRGTVAFSFDTPVGAFDLPIEWAGAFYDDRFSAGLEGAVDLPFIGSADVSGSLQALLIDRYVEPDGG